MSVAQLKIVILGVLLLVSTGVHLARGRPSENGVSMAEALKMLQQLDRHYAQISKPRFGRSSDRSSFHEEPKDVAVIFQEYLDSNYEQ